MNSLPQNYIQVIADLKDKIRAARQRAILTVNKELTLTYWEIGKVIIQLQKEEGWGAKVIDRLSVDLKTEFPDFKGLSSRNLKYMSLFAKTFPQFGQQLAAQIQSKEVPLISIGQQLVAQLPWGHLQVLMDKTDRLEVMDFYIQKCVENGWSRNILTEQINSNLFSRQGNAITNFKETLPQVQSDLAQQTFKNPYIFDFLALGEEMKERELENALIYHLKNFMLELGKGFAYVGRQKNLVVQGDDFFLDLLFYNYNMHCFVVFELKVGDFKPEFAGKLNFYVQAINEQLKGPADKPTIGVLLCKTPNETVVRYSLQGIESPIGVADYQLAQALPKQLKGEMPTVEELEAEIDKEYEELKNPTQKKLEALKQRLANLSGAEVRTPVSYEILCKIHDEGLVPLFNELLKRLEVFHPDFMSHNYFWSGKNNLTNLEQVNSQWKDEQYLRSTRDHYFFYRLNGLRQAGVQTFDTSIRLEYLITNPYWYGFVLQNRDNGQPFLQKLYSEMLTPSDIQLICDKVCDELIDDIGNRVSYIEKVKKDKQ